VAEAFRSQGYLLIETPQGGPAGVGELVVRRERTTFLVDCRRWRAGKVGVDAVHALQSAMAARGADGGFVLTTGRFGREAVAYAGGCNIQLVDRPALEVLLRRVSRR
jgi:restriction system protein